MKKCSLEAFARCGMKEHCESINDAVFMEGSECDRFNQLVQKYMSDVEGPVCDLAEQLIRIILSTPPIPAYIYGRRCGKRYLAAKHFAAHLISCGVTVQRWKRCEPPWWRIFSRWLWKKDKPKKPKEIKT